METNLAFSSYPLKMPWAAVVAFCWLCGVSNVFSGICGVRQACEFEGHRPTESKQKGGGNFRSLRWKGWREWFAEERQECPDDEHWVARCEKNDTDTANVQHPVCRHILMSTMVKCPGFAICCGHMHIWWTRCPAFFPPYCTIFLTA